MDSAVRLPFQGTGSMPPGCQGWQRASRRAASQAPRATPCFRIASRAYSEQVGWKRQLRPEQRTDRHLVAADQACQQALHHRELPQAGVRLPPRPAGISSRQQLRAQPAPPHPPHQVRAASRRKCFPDQSLDSITARLACAQHAFGQPRSPAAQAAVVGTADAVNHRPDPRLRALRPRLKSAPDRSRAVRGKPATEATSGRRQTADSNATARAACGPWHGAR